MNKTFLFTAMIILSLVSCTFSTTRVLNPVFHTSEDSLEVQLSRLVRCENIIVNGKEITTNKKVHTALEAQIINGKNIPVDENKINIIGKQIATVLRNALENNNEFEEFKIVFVQKKEISGATVTNSNIKTYALKELQ